MYQNVNAFWKTSNIVGIYLTYLNILQIFCLNIKILHFKTWIKTLWHLMNVMNISTLFLTGTITLKILPKIETKGLTADDVTALSDQSFGVMHSAFLEISGQATQCNGPSTHWALCCCRALSRRQGWLETTLSSSSWRRKPWQPDALVSSPMA